MNRASRSVSVPWQNLGVERALGRVLGLGPDEARRKRPFGREGMPGRAPPLGPEIPRVTWVSSQLQRAELPVRTGTLGSPERTSARTPATENRRERVRREPSSQRVTAADRIAPPRPGTGGLLVLTGLVKHPHQLRAAAAGHPDTAIRQATIQLPAASMLLTEGVEGGEECGHGPTRSPDPPAAGVQSNAKWAVLCKRKLNGQPLRPCDAI